ncbi:MAG: OadG family protein [Fretibacterium sp.]|nr:OadG family protein [Fretibacterium sp.]
MQFEGISGAINVSIVAFSIVFGVLLVLTATIYTIKMFSGSGEKPAGGSSAGKGAAAPAKAAPAAAPLQASGSPQAKIVAAITAAILAMTGGRGRILSIQPAATTGGRSFSTWRASGVVALVNNRLNRPWNR